MDEAAAAMQTRSKKVITDNANANRSSVKRALDGGIVRSIAADSSVQSAKSAATITKYEIPEDRRRGAAHLPRGRRTIRATGASESRPVPGVAELHCIRRSRRPQHVLRRARPGCGLYLRSNKRSGR